MATSTPKSQLQLTKQQITTAINNYTAILQDGNALVQLYNQGDCFKYITQHYQPASPAIHAYPAIHEDHFIFLMIPSHFDTVAYADDIADYVQSCEVFSNMRGGELPTPPGGEISPTSALHRINCWIDNYQTWIPQRCCETVGMFQAFKIGMDDFNQPEVYVNLGLRTITKPTLRYEPDLIVINEDAKTQVMTFDDFAKPVPPYSAAAAATDFYLLSL